jgi:hypothetical protein
MTTRAFPPNPLSVTEWQEIFNTPRVRYLWADGPATAAEFALATPAARFDGYRESAGFVGDVYVLLASHVDAPVVFVREADGTLRCTTH